MEQKIYSWTPAGSLAAVSAVRVPKSAGPLTKKDWRFRLADRLADLMIAEEIEGESEELLRGALDPDEAEFVLAQPGPLTRAEALLMLERVSDRLEAEAEGQVFPVTEMEHVPEAAVAIEQVSLAEWISAVIPLGDAR